MQEMGAGRVRRAIGLVKCSVNAFGSHFGKQNAKLSLAAARTEID
jgi:hypothetical protein